MLRDLGERVERGLARSNAQPAVVVDVDLAHSSGGVSTPVQVEFRTGDSARSIWLPAANGVVPAVGEPVTILFNGADAIIVPRPGTLVEGGWQSANFPGFGLGGPGWGLDFEGNLEANDATFRGIVNASGGPNLLDNGDFEVDISGWDTDAQTQTHETDTDLTRGASAGSLRINTASETTERFIESDPVDIDPNDALRLDAWVLGLTSNRAKVAIRFLEADESFIDEVEGEYVDVFVGTNVFHGVTMQSTPPAVETGFLDYQPNEDVAFATVFGGGGSPVNTAGNRYQNVNEVALDTSDYVFAGALASVDHDWRANVGSGNLAGRTIAAVEVLIDAARISGDTSIQASLDIDGDLHMLPSRALGGLNRHGFRWDSNPSTDAPWTISDVEALDTTDHVRTELNGDGRAYRYTLRVHWQEDLPTPTKASARVYLDPGGGGTHVWWVDDVELRKESSGTFPVLQSAESGRRWELDNIDRPEFRLIDDDGNDIATIGRRTGVALERATNTNITTLNTIGVSWETEGHQEPDGYWTSGANVVIPAGMDGLYAVNFSCIFTGAAATLLWPSFSVRNSFGSTVPTLEQFSSFSGSRGWAFTEWLEAGDTFSCLVHNSGGSTITLDLAHLQLHRVVSG